MLFYKKIKITTIRMSSSKPESEPKSENNVLSHKESVQETNNEAKIEENKDNYDDSFLPSLIICPTTLTNHWFHEIERFVDNSCLNPLIYCGSVAERECLRRKFFNGSQIKSKTGNNNKILKYNVLIVSYDIIRHDVNFINSQQWNYCILDEGHLILFSFLP